jgi:dienelactone hydrolase
MSNHRPFLLFLSACGAASAAPLPAAAPDAATAAAPDAATADESGCAVPGTVVSYLHMTTTDLTDTRCGAATGSTCTIDLEGFLFLPPVGTTQRGAIVYNHGSEQKPGPKCSIVEYFVPQGYVVFVPHRRGHGRSTGVYVGDYTGAQIDYLKMQVADVQAAYAYVKALPGVDATKIGIMGHSYGGIMTLLTNATSLGQPAVVDLCGDSESWSNTSFETALIDAVNNAKAPIFFAQPANDVHTSPTIEFAHQAGTDGQQFQSAIYPSVPNAATAQDAHSLFVGDATEVAQWGVGALDFFHRYGM